MKRFEKAGSQVVAEGKSGLFLDPASVCPSAKGGLEDPDRLGFALRRLGNPAWRYIG